MAVHEEQVARAASGGGAAGQAVVVAAALHLLDARRLERSTLVSECLPARDRAGLPPDTSIDDLLAVGDVHATGVLARCVESVAGTAVDDVLRAGRTG